MNGFIEANVRDSNSHLLSANLLSIALVQPQKKKKKFMSFSLKKTKKRTPQSTRIVTLAIQIKRSDKLLPLNLKVKDLDLITKVLLYTAL